jgi:hypothetical protein
MKTKVEINGYEIEIELVDGVITVKAEKDDEVVEEFSLETEEFEGEGEEGEEVQGFGEFDEEEDFEEGELGQDEEEFGQEESEEGELKALESFQSFLRKNKAK